MSQGTDETPPKITITSSKPGSVVGDMLDRLGPKQAIEEHFSESIDLVNEVVEYGVALIVRSLRRQRAGVGMDTVIPLGCVFKQGLGMADAAAVLVSAGAVRPAYLQVRSLFEASLGLQWMLSDQVEHRALAYHVADLRREGAMAREMLTPEWPPTPTSFDAEYITEVKRTAQANVNDIDGILSREEYRPINELFEAWRQKHKRNHDPNWYTALGIGSIKKLAENLDRSLDYQAIYARTSQVAHAVSEYDHISVTSDAGTHMMPIRTVSPADDILHYTATLSATAIRVVTEHFAPEEMSALRSRVQENWRPRWEQIKVLLPGPPDTQTLDP